MSVFIADLNEEESQNIKKTRKKYHTKYNEKYKEEYPWALPSSKGDLYAFCQICYVDISIKSVGAKGLRDHEATCRHSQKSHEMRFRTGLSNTESMCTVSSQQQQIQNTYDQSQLQVQPSHTQMVSANIPGQYTPETYRVQTREFPHTSQEKSHVNHNLMVPLVGQTSLLTSHSMSSTSYPVLEVVEGEMQNICRSPQTPQTPNTPASPLTTDNFMQKLNPNATSPLPTINSHIDERFHTNFVPESSLTNCDVKRNFQKKLDCGAVQDSSVIVNRDISEEAVDQQGKEEGIGSPSVDDLTCNICGLVFPDWRALKKDLLNHIKDANAKKTQLGNQELDDGSRRRVKKVAKLKKLRTLPSNKEPGNIKPKRGRPPGRRKKTEGTKQQLLTKITSSQIDFGNTNSSIEGDPPYGKVPNNTPVSAVKPTPKKRGRPCKKKDSPKPQPNPPEEQIPLQISSSELSSMVEDIYLCDSSPSQNNSDQSPNDAMQSRVPKSTGTKRSGQLQCRVCRAMFYLRQELKDHYQKQHNNGRPYYCESCDKFFTTKNNLEVHKKHKHIEGPNPCLCKICGKVLSSRTNLKIHLMIHKGERPFSCPVCSKSFSRKANMEMHMVYHTGERRFTCEICGQSFFALNALKRHRKLHSGKREFACDICDAAYVTGTDLKRHRLKHEAVKPFPCTICDKQFTRSHDLKVHMRYHNKEIRFTCNVCGKQFVESGNYRRHMRRHTGERPYTCGICDQSFSQVHHYKVHVRANHSDQTDASVEWASQSRLSSARNQTISQRVSPPKRNQKIPNSTQNNVPNQIITHQLGPPPSATPSTSMNNNVIPEHIPNIHAVHIHNANNVPIHNNAGATTIANITPISSAVGNMADIQHPQSVSVSPTAAATHVPMMTSHHSQVVPQTAVNHPTTGFIQYNSYVYNTGVISPYQPLFEMCPQ